MVFVRRAEHKLPVIVLIKAVQLNGVLQYVIHHVEFAVEHIEDRGEGIGRGADIDILFAVLRRVFAEGGHYVDHVAHALVIAAESVRYDSLPFA